MRTIAIGDIHGGLRALTQVLNKVEVKDEDKLIFVGDYVDGWSEAAQVVQLLIELSQKVNCVCIKGNHDVWTEEWLRSGEVNQTWYMHGGKETMESYSGFSEEDKKAHLAFFESMPLYHLDDENRLFLHAGFTSVKGIEHELDQRYFYLDRTLWEMALTMKTDIDENDVIYPKRLKFYKEVYIGHTPTTNFGVEVPMNAMNIWNIDTGAAFKGRVTAMNVDTKEFVQSDNLPDLYPNETGRNKS
ncbi:metallophosphoesterase family protein [Tamlana sp. 2_MG-2023]|uniref:metallophosphoesterase family protein n=1 Tax=unclassified Tamlana TaxID=2614803 RepID=UPI0026E43631|nr:MULTISPECIES: metallophosphoesterase family protein [unclassified Tamlana]MDO6760927.1 metallophosphoesterase family protein [Tamlana sp. 2_MG-2023]MDO6791183.1 metallophosphoesterase family protein [Tamlana sp. 1_MG-2023]